MLCSRSISMSAKKEKKKYRLFLLCYTFGNSNLTWSWRGWIEKQIEANQLWPCIDLETAEVWKQLGFLLQCFPICYSKEGYSVMWMWVTSTNISTLCTLCTVQWNWKFQGSLTECMHLPICIFNVTFKSIQLFFSFGFSCKEPASGEIMILQLPETAAPEGYPGVNAIVQGVDLVLAVSKCKII